MWMFGGNGWSPIDVAHFFFSQSSSAAKPAAILFVLLLAKLCSPPMCNEIVATEELLFRPFFHEELAPAFIFSIRDVLQRGTVLVFHPRWSKQPHRCHIQSLWGMLPRACTNSPLSVAFQKIITQIAWFIRHGTESGEGFFIKGVPKSGTEDGSTCNSMLIGSGTRLCSRKWVPSRIKNGFVSPTKFGPLFRNIGHVSFVVATFRSMSLLERAHSIASLA